MSLQQQEQEVRNIVQSEENKADRVEIIFYTDPLCCWSWAFEPQWRKLQYQFNNKIVFRNVMTGLLPSWKNYSDSVYSVSRPQQMGPVWMQAGETSGMPMNSRIWVEDPPASSYPACIAVKAIELQSQDAAIKYLRLLREAVMLQGQNIAKQDVLIQVAKTLSGNFPGSIDLATFTNDLTNDNGLEAFRPDWQEAQNRNITRTPTLIMRTAGSPAIMLTGYRPYPVLVEALKQVAPNMQPAVEKIDVEGYKHFWGNLTQREIEEIL
jgi:predicted DsbA family dithiol-disulfide isomerase